MFETLSDRLGNIFKGLTGRGHLSEADVSAALREVRRALIEADVSLEVVRAFVEQVGERAKGAEVTRSITPGQRIAVGTRKPPSHCVAFSLRNIVVPPSGQENTSAPLSVEYMTMVLSSTPSSLSLASNSPTMPSCSTMPSA